MEKIRQIQVDFSSATPNLLILSSIGQLNPSLKAKAPRFLLKRLFSPMANVKLTDGVR